VSLSIIIPTLNEAKFLDKTLTRIKEFSNDFNQLEIIVVDSGSSDKTVEIARDNYFCSVHEHPELKGKKYAILNKGASYAKGNHLLFLDADTLLPANFDQLILNHLNNGYVGGAFEFKLDGKNWGLRFIEIANRTRYRLGQKYYGDQGVFCSKSAFYKINGFPQKPILESAHFCAALKKNGKLKLIKEPVVTSSRRFTRSKLGPIWVLTVDTGIFLLDKFGFRSEKIGKYYWSVNDQE